MTHEANTPDRSPSAGKLKLVKWIFLAVGLVFSGVGATYLYNSYTFQQTAIATEAEVLSVERRETRKRDSDGHWKTSVTYQPTLRYEDQYGTEHVGTPNLRSSSYNFPVGSIVEVAYSPENPTDLRINDFLSTWGFGGFFFLFGLIFTAIGYFATAGFQRKAQARTGSVNRMR